LKVGDALAIPAPKLESNPQATPPTAPRGTAMPVIVIRAQKKTSAYVRVEELVRSIIYKGTMIGKRRRVGGTGEKLSHAGAKEKGKTKGG